MTGQQHRVRRVENLHGTYPALDSEPGIPVVSIAATSPLAQARPEPPSSESVSIGLRDRSVYSDVLVNRLEKTAADIESGIADASPAVKESVASWCDLHGFVPSDDETSSIIAHQAVFGLLLKATLYEWCHRRGELPKFDGDAHEQFQLAHEETGDPAFSPCELDEILWSVEEANTVAVTEARDQLLESTQPATDIGRLYEALISGEHRRVLGQYRTPRDLAELMRTWATSGGDTVLDPGMGAGELSVPFHPDWEISTDPARVDGVDRSPLAALMGRVAQTISGQRHETHRTDFFEVSLGDLGGKVDSTVCNPPYTRHQQLPTEYKDKLNRQAENQTELDIPRTSPLYAYFYYHLRQFLDTESRAAVLTPHHFLAREYGKALKEFLLREFDVKAFVMSDPDTGSRFENAETTEVVAFLEPKSADSDTGVTRFIRVDENPGQRTILEAVRNTEQGERAWGFVNCINQADLDPERKWDVFFDPIDIETSILTPFSELADISRGLQTGENDFFCLSQADVESTGIDTGFLSRMVPPPRFVDGYDVRPDDWPKYSKQDRPMWLLYHVDSVEGVPETTYDAEAECADWCDSSIGTKSASAVVEYLCHGLPDHETLQTRTTVHTRDPWYRVERGDTAPILITPMTRSKVRVLLNETDARHLNSYYGIYPESTIGRTEQKALLAYLNSGFVDSIVSRHQHTLAGGLDKLEPGDVKKLPVIDPRELADEVVDTLAEYFDDLREAARRSEDRAAIINQIDTVLQREL